MKKLWLAISLGLAAADCGGMARTNVGDLCLPGDRTECDCATRTKGVRTCTAAGVGYGPCMCGGGTGDGGITIDAGGPPVESCTSKSTWMGGLSGSPDMTPGRPCIECHTMTPRSPQYTVAGTIFPGRRDADDCNGIDGLGVAVAFLRDDGSEIRARVQVNGVGNFFLTAPMPAQYRVKVIAQGKESVMLTPVTNGDCNLCHTAAGELGASGRLMKP
jgi:hypothetical protein